jgi:hypothetical protein
MPRPNHGPFLHSSYRMDASSSIAHGVALVRIVRERRQLRRCIPRSGRYAFGATGYNMRESQ